MTLQQLQYAVALDTHRHFVKAANHCHVAQPTLTLQLKKLEEELSVVLFDRSRQPLEPTPIGESFVARAREVLHRVEELKELVAEERSELCGSFRLGVIPTLAPSVLPLFISDFMEEHPETSLSVEELQSQAIIDRLKNRDLDFGLLATPLEEKDLREVPVFYEPFMVYAHDRHPMLSHRWARIDELEADDLWLLRKGHCFRNQTLNLCNVDQEKKARNLTMEGGSIETLKRMIRKVSGYTLVPELSYQEQDAPNVIRFASPQPVREISLVVHKYFSREELLSELVNSIRNGLPESMLENNPAQTVRWR